MDIKTLKHVKGNEELKETIQKKFGAFMLSPFRVHRVSESGMSSWKIWATESTNLS